MNKKAGTFLGILIGIVLAIIIAVIVSIVLDFNLLNWISGLIQKVVCG